MYQPTWSQYEKNKLKGVDVNSATTSLFKFLFWLSLASVAIDALFGLKPTPFSTLWRGWFLLAAAVIPVVAAFMYWPLVWSAFALVGAIFFTVLTLWMVERESPYPFWNLPTEAERTRSQDRAFLLNVFYQVLVGLIGLAMLIWLTYLHPLGWLVLAGTLLYSSLVLYAMAHWNEEWDAWSYLIAIGAVAALVWVMAP